MKRGAERQLTKDGPDDEDVQEIQDPQGFQKADESTLAKRQIRALPKRALTASSLPSLNGLSPVPASDVAKVDSTPQPKFGEFAGFGATPASNPFAFSAQPPALSPFVFDTALKSSQSIPTSVSPPFLNVPKLAPSDSDAPATCALAEETDAVAFKYFKSLRGLNVSFLSAISTAVEKDPFFDVANLIESYRNLRTTIQSEFDGSTPSTIRGPFVTNSTAIFGAKALPEKIPSFSVPKPPAGSVGVSPKLASTSESSTKAGGFTFPPFVPPSSSVTTRLPFGLIPKPSESSSPPAITPEPPKSAFTFTASNTSTSMSSLPLPSGLSSATPSSLENTTSKSGPDASIQEIEGSSASASPRSISTAPSVGNVPNLFAAAKPISAFGSSDPASKPTLIFGSSVFGSNSTTESSKSTPFDPPLSDREDGSKTSTIFFGNPAATPSSTSASIFQSSEKPVSSFGSASPPKAGAFAFGKPAGSIGNPVGFGFGSSSPSIGDTATPGSTSSGFNFAISSTKPSERLFSPPVTSMSSESTPQPEAEGNDEGEEDDAVKLLPSHTHDGEGEGEEDEETTHVVRCKIFRLSKSEDKGEWKDLGVGMFRLKKYRETNVRRVLMRNSNTGRILVNFRIHGSLKLTLAKNTISFVGYENNTPTSFSVRVKTEEQARDLKQALEREIAAAQTAE